MNRQFQVKSKCINVVIDKFKYQFKRSFKENHDILWSGKYMILQLI